ncbi:MAG: hypothetical protein WCK02_07905 [Bacteroidota bacterium]
MKKLISMSLAISMLIMFSIKAKAQFTFSVSPGLQLNSANFGYKYKKFIPYISLQVVNGGYNLIEKGVRSDYSTNSLINYEDKYKLNGTIYIPTLGVKYFFKETNKLKAYGNISFTKLFFSGKLESTGNIDASSEFKDDLKAISVYGGQLGFGSEYFFDENFSVGGEFGFRILNYKYEKETDVSVYDGNTGTNVQTKRKYEYTYNLNPTYMKISLNFYFNKKS